MNSVEAACTNVLRGTQAFEIPVVNLSFRFELLVPLTVLDYLLYLGSKPSSTRTAGTNPARSFRLLLSTPPSTRRYRSESERTDYTTRSTTESAQCGRRAYDSN